jgi:DNA adenine methylase
METYTALNSPIRYYGGKGGMKYDIIEHFPEKGSYGVYIEPFGGGASILFAMEPTPVEIYNDLEENVYSLFKVVSDKELFHQFKQLCDLCYFSRQLRDEYEQELKRDDLTMVQRAFKYWYVNRSSYSGSGGFSINLSIRRGMSKSTSDFLSTVDNLINIHERLSRVVIEHTDGINLIKKYNSENIFLYCDPPYHSSTRVPGAKYKCDMTDEQHKELIDALLECKSKVIVSGYNNPEYDKLVVAGWKKIDFDVNTIDSKRSPRVKVESLWKNY